MDVKGTLAHLAGRIIKPIRSGEDELAGKKVETGPIITVESSSFPRDGRIPDGYAGDDGRSPELRWSNVPDGTAELVVLCEDPDAPMPRPFVHWIVYGIPPDTTELSEGLPPTGAPLGNGIQQGRNSMKKEGYFGPAPPPGHGVHHYHFQVFAVDEPLDLSAPVDRDQLVDAMRDHVLAIGEVVGTYER